LTVNLSHVTYLLFDRWIADADLAGDTVLQILIFQEDKHLLHVEMRAHGTIAQRYAHAFTEQCISLHDEQ